jgi:hypothetical protein
MVQAEVVARVFREVCGDYFPAEFQENKRFVLTVPFPEGGVYDDPDQIIRVPVFIRREEKAQYPEIRISPFITSPEKYHGYKYTRTVGVPPMEAADLLYKRTRVDAKIIRSTFQVDVYATDEVELYRIRDALKDRIHRFNYVETASFIEIEGWEEIADNVYLNEDYNPDLLQLYKVYEDGVRLTKTDDIENTVGSWNLTEEGLYVHPYDDINKIEYWEITNGGLTLSDGNTIRSKGIYNITTLQSRAFEEVDPLIVRWLFVFRVDYLSTTEMDVGRTFGKVNANAKKS